MGISSYKLKSFFHHDMHLNQFPILVKITIGFTPLSVKKKETPKCNFLSRNRVVRVLNREKMKQVIIPTDSTLPVSRFSIDRLALLVPLLVTIYLPNFFEPFINSVKINSTAIRKKVGMVVLKNVFSW